MNNDLLKVYAQSHLRPAYNYFLSIAVFVSAKIYTTPAAAASFNLALTLLFLALAASIGMLALANERRIYREILAGKQDFEGKSLFGVLAVSKALYVFPWLIFLFWPLQSDFIFYHLVGYFFIFCAIAAYGTASSSFYPLFLFDVGLQICFVLGITLLNHDVQETKYIGWAVAIFGAYILLNGYKTSQATKELVESRRMIGESAALAEKAHKARTDFLSVMSHEIRTPMAGILGMVDFMRDTRLSPEQKSCLETITQCSQTLLNTLNDVLDISREESGNPVIRQINYSLHDVLQNTARAMHHTAEKKGLTLECKIHDTVPQEIGGDPHRVQQIVFNLLNNAVKFTEKGFVTLSASMSKDDMILIEVRDTGIGISRDKIQNLFKKFSQADHSIAHKYGGSGLGLSITKRLVELMGGKIGVRSNKGKGSVFWFSLPCHPTDEEDTSAPAEVIELKPAQVLLVEDNPVNQMIALRFLEKKGHSVTIAPDGENALRLLENGQRFDLILMDSTLPGKSGIDTTKEIKRMDARTAAIPIIALTADAMPEHVKACLNAGMAAHVTKPFVSEHLYKTMAEHIKTFTGTKKTTRSSTAAKPVVSHFMQDPVLNDKLSMMKEELGDEYMRHVVTSSLDEMRALLEKASAAHQDNNLDQLRRAVHDLKSVSGYVGLSDTAALCAEIEALCATEKPDALSVKMVSLLTKSAEDIGFLKKTIV